MLGLVIPVFKKKYIKTCVSSVLRQTKRTDLFICIVNDGRAELVPWLDKIIWPPNVYVLHLQENRCFAGANNAGWEYILQKHPDIKYLGTLNDDTLCYPECMDYLVECLEQHPNAGMVSVTQHIPKGWFQKKESLAVWRFGERNRPTIVLQEAAIKQDTRAAVLAGVCLVAHTNRLLEAGMFDPNYINSCEDVDISLSIRKCGWDLYVATNAHLVHYAGKSRYSKNANPNMHKSAEYLKSKWGNVTFLGYNNLEYFYT